jgi:hypothetical protein
VSWLFGENPGFSEVEVRLTAEGDERTRFELEHVAIVPPEMWDQFGPGAVGVGWDLTVVGLGLHLRGRSIGDPSEMGGLGRGTGVHDAQQRGMGRCLRGVRSADRCGG